MGKGWIKVHRKFLEWEWYEDTNTVRVFLHLLLKANWKEGRSKGMTVPRGSFVASQLDISEKLGLTRQQVRTAFDKLKATREITTKKARTALLITVCKYDEYNEAESSEQPTPQPPEQPRNNQRSTTEQPRSNHEITTIEEGKNKKKERREEYEGESNHSQLNQICSRISDLVPSWSPHLTHPEQINLSDNLPKWQSLTDDDWSVLRAWFADTSDRTQFRIQRKENLIQRVDEELAKAREAGFTAATQPRRNHDAGPEWMPDNWRTIAAEITEQPESDFHTLKDVPTRHRFAFERACKDHGANDERQEDAA